MSAEGFIEVVRLRLHEERRKAEHRLGRGDAKDFMAYREAVGQIKGFEAAQRVVEDEWAKLFHEAEDDRL